MEINKKRYLLYQKKAVLEAHLKAINDQIHKIETNYHYDQQGNDDGIFRRSWSDLNKEGE